MKLYRNWIINEVARAGEHTNERTYIRTYVLTYIRTGQTLYPLHNFVVRGDNTAQASVSLCCKSYKAKANLERLHFLGSKVNLMHSLFISIFLYACDLWTLKEELKKRMQAFEIRCNRKLLNTSYKNHVTNEDVRRKIYPSKPWENMIETETEVV